MPSLYDPNALTESLELDYVSRPRPLHRWLRRLTWAAGGAALVWALWILWPANHTALQAGPLATPHAMFNHDCGKCHTEAFTTAMRLVPDNHGLSSIPDAACMKCHPGPDHNRFVKADKCTSCHKEHRGLGLLARPSDQHCTTCHAQHPDFKFESVPSFTAHPEFALWRSKAPADPGTVEFNHHKHLSLRTDNKIAPESAIRKLQEMQCAFCHQPDAAGKYMQPIPFDKHCQECHPLLLHVNVKADLSKDPLKPAILSFQKEPLPHPTKGQTAWNVRAAARERYLNFAQAYSGILELKSAAADDWMVLPGLPTRSEPATKSQLDWVNQQWKQAEIPLFDKEAGCARCHAEVSKKDVRLDGLPDFGQPTIPTRWFQHSVFDHKAHRMVDCMSCHEKAKTSENHRDVLMPKLESCQKCHKPGPGSARSDCMECHQFHHK